MMERLRDSKWVYVLLSIVLAFVFWLYVRAELDPDDSSWIYNVPVEVTGSSVLTRQGLTISDLSADTVNLYVEGSTSVIDNLLRNWEDISVTIDVSKCTEGENKLSYDINYPLSVNPENVTATDRNPEIITVTVDKLYTSTFEVEFQFKGTVASGYTIGTPAISPETVMVSGSEEQVSQVAKVVAILEGNKLSERFAGDLPLTLLDADGKVLTDLEVTLDSNTAYVVLPVVVVKEIPLTVNILAGGGAAVSDCDYDIEPKSITVSGAEEDIQSLTELSLGSIDLSQVVGSNTITFPISLDSSLENVSGITYATVTVTVNGLATRSFDVNNITWANKPTGCNVTLVTQMRTVMVRGKEEDLKSIDASQLRIVADLSDVTTVGTYPVPAKVYLDANGSVGVIGDYTVTVTISR